MTTEKKSPEEQYIAHIEARHLSAEQPYRHVDITMSELVGFMNSIGATCGDPGLTGFLTEKAHAFAEVMQQYIGTHLMDVAEPSHAVRVKVAYLAKFVNPERMYPVTYVSALDGTKLIGAFELPGSKLSEKQIFELFEKEIL